MFFDNALLMDFKFLSYAHSSMQHFHKRWLKKFKMWFSAGSSLEAIYKFQFGKLANCYAYGDLVADMKFED